MQFVYCAFEVAENGEEVAHVCTTPECAFAIKNAVDVRVMPLIERPDQRIDLTAVANEQVRIESMRAEFAVS